MGCFTVRRRRRANAHSSILSRGTQRLDFLRQTLFFLMTVQMVNNNSSSLRPSATKNRFGFLHLFENLKIEITTAFARKNQE